MQFIKAGEPADSNIFNKLDERKRRLLASGRDVINLSIGTPDFQPDRHVMEAVSRAALDPEQYKYSLTETRALLDAVQDWYSRRYGVQLADEEDVYKRQCLYHGIMPHLPGEPQAVSPPNCTSPERNPWN